MNTALKIVQKQVLLNERVSLYFFHRIQFCSLPYLYAFSIIVKGQWSQCMRIIQNANKLPIKEIAKNLAKIDCGSKKQQGIYIVMYAKWNHLIASAKRMFCCGKSFSIKAHDF